MRLKWLSWYYLDAPQYGLMLDDRHQIGIVMRNYYRHEPKNWIWELVNPDNIDDAIQGRAPTAALAAYDLVSELRVPSADRAFLLEFTDVFMRAYKEDDYDSCVAVIESSVRAYCHADHGNDEDTIQLWCEAANKGLDTMEYGVIMETHPDNVVAIAAVEENRITLNYVANGYKGGGVSRRMMCALYYHIQGHGYKNAYLISTVGARHFYRKDGWTEFGQPVKGNGVSWNFPMTKRLYE